MGLGLFWRFIFGVLQGFCGGFLSTAVSDLLVSFGCVTLGFPYRFTGGVEVWGFGPGVQDWAQGIGFRLSDFRNRAGVSE